MIVVDASVLATSLVDDGPDGDSARRRLIHEELVAPELMDLEIISTVRRLLAAGLLDQRRCEQALTDLEVLPLRRVSHRPLTGRVWALRDNLTPYDAAYIALAEQLDVSLLTADRKLAAAPGPRCRVELLA